jgi:DNA-directed RNA polymerase subunit RPC12/RpoP
MSLISKKLMRHAYACSRCGEKIGDHNYTAHIIRHAFQDMESSRLIKMVKCKHEFDEAEQPIEHLAN